MSLKKILVSPWALPVALLIVLLLVLLPYLLLGENAYVRIVDNLDSEFVYLCLLKQDHQLFSLSGNEIIPQIMDGLPRSCLRSGFNHIGVLFYFFSPFTAYVINVVFVRIIGFAGMYLLARDYFLREKREYVLPVAIAFSLISIYTLYGLSVIGLPLLFWAMLNIYKGVAKRTSWIIVVCFPLCSYLIMAGPFALTLLSSLGLYLTIIHKKIKWPYWFAILTIGVLYVLTEFPLIANIFSKSFTSHRAEWIVTKPDLSDVFKQFAEIFLKLQIEASVFFAPLMLIMSIMAIRSENERTRRHLLLLLVAFSAIALFYVIYPFLQSAVPALLTINLRRFTTLLPLLIFIAWCISLNKLRLNVWVGMLLITIQISFIVFSNDELRSNLSRTVLPDRLTDKKLSFAKFFATPLFEDVKTFLGQDPSSYHIACFAFPSSVAQYNGFYTLDSYQNNYPLEYKHTFRPVIAAELEKNEALKKYFDGWGSRCLILSNEFDMDYVRATSTEFLHPVADLSINTTTLKNMGCKFILSAVEIQNFALLDLQHSHTFTHGDEKRKIWLYKLQ